MTTDTLADTEPAPVRPSGGTVATACPSSPDLGVGERPRVLGGDVVAVVDVVIPCTLRRP